MVVGDQVLEMLKASKLRYNLKRSLMGIILLMRRSSRIMAGCITVFGAQKGTRPLKPVPLIEKLLNIPVTGVSLKLIFALEYGRALLNVMMEETCQLFTR